MIPLGLGELCLFVPRPSYRLQIHSRFWVRAGSEVRWRIVHMLFVMVREHVPSLIFTDGIDSMGGSRWESGRGGSGNDVAVTKLAGRIGVHKERQAFYHQAIYSPGPEARVQSSYAFILAK